ncbi:hypothetical protein ACWCOP_00580 [Maricaulaceae bacterium MS644]
MKTVFLAAFGAAAFTGAASAQCYEVGADGAEYTEMSGYELREETARPGLMDPPPLSEEAAGIMCVRDTIVPDANDFELVRYRGVPLFLRDGEGDDARVLAIGFVAADMNEAGEETPPQYLVRRVQGELTEDDIVAITGALEAFADAETALDAYIAEQSESED